MSSFDILERFNDYSTELIDANPKVRTKALYKLMKLYYDAPELHVSVLAKLDQLSGDSDEAVASVAKRLLDQVRSGRQYSAYDVPHPTRTSSSTTGTRETTAAPQNMKAIVGNIICCVIILIIYFVFIYVV
ncbi:MAG TPA: hypothetical protein VMV49_11790 [Candidatus Deferrimicrobium sp.]|nr:hypothetical protein [Candidatus Deferrimicrobium sp.]